MTLTPVEAVGQVENLRKLLNAQKEDAEKWGQYYDGKQSLNFSSLEWRNWFGKQYEGFSDNWCAPVVDATAERQGLDGVRLYGDSKINAEFNRIMSVNGADVDFSAAATEAQYARRAYTLVWPNAKDPATPLVTYESPTQMYVRHVAGSRREADAALKVWTDDVKDYATLYTAEVVYKFERYRGGTESGLVLPRSFTGGWRIREVPGEAWPLPNPLGEVPVSELPNRSRLTGKPISAISGVAAMQDAVNLLWAHLFTASDFSAMPQRVLLGAQLPPVPVLNEEGQKVGEKPMIDLPEVNIRRVLNFDSPTAKIASWESASLEGFLKVIDRAIAHIIDQTRTPAYYFSSGNTIANISGDTVKALDAGLVKKVNRANGSMHDGLRRTARLTFLAAGKPDLAAQVEAGKVQFANPEILSEAQKADALSKYKDLGMPFSWLVKQIVDDADEVESIVAEYEKQGRDQTLERLVRDLPTDPQFTDQG